MPRLTAATKLVFYYIATVYIISTADNVECRQPPNIIMIMADDMGWNDVGFHGSDELSTPNIDALAYNGVALHRHYSLPTCTPSRAALLTGRHPIRTGMQGTPIGAGSPLGIPTNETLLPQYLKRFGYTTHLVGKWHVGCYTNRHLPTHRGFDTHFGYYNGYIGYYDGIHINSKSVGGLDVRRNEKPAWSEIIGNYATEYFTDEAVRIIKRHNKRRPLFLELAHLAPHTGNIGARRQVPSLRQNEKEFGYIKDIHRRLYAGMVKELDRSVGQVLNALDEASMLDNSIVIFMSDNGAPTVEPLWDTGNSGSNWPLRGEKGSLHEGGIRTVAAIWSPHLARPSSLYRQNFHLIDWLPTLYAAAGGNPNDLEGVDGVDHWRNLVNFGGQQQNSVLNRNASRHLLLNIDEVEGNEAIIAGKWKLIKNNRSSRLAFADHYYGSRGSGNDIPGYNLTAVLESDTGRILELGNEKYYDNNKNVEFYLRLRRESTINCNEFNGIQSDRCYDSYCLFDLHDDPCETKDLSDQFKDVARELEMSLENFRSQLRPRKVAHFDPRSDPKYWDNYWSVWVHDQSASFSTYLNCNRLLMFVSFVFVKFMYRLN